jgi:predicted ester cyclase
MRAPLLISLLCLSASPGAALAAEPQDPLTRLAAACAAGKVEDAVQIFTGDGQLILAVEGMPDERYVGPEPIRSFFRAQIKGCKLQLKDGKMATLSNDRYRRAGVPEVSLELEPRARGESLEYLRMSVVRAQTSEVARATVADNRAAIQRFLDKVNRKEEMAAIEEIISEVFINHTYMPMPPNREGLRAFYREFRKGFPEIHFTVERMIAEGDMVVVHLTGRYVHQGEFMGVAGTGKAVTVSKMDFFRLQSGMVTEHWDVIDRLGLLQQIGVVPNLPRWTPSTGYEESFR